MRSWQIKGVQDPRTWWWDSPSRSLIRRYNQQKAFNEDARNNTAFQHLLTKLGCCADGKIAVGTRNVFEHWTEGGLRAKIHLLRYASRHVELGIPVSWISQRMLRRPYLAMPKQVEKFYRTEISKIEKQLKKR